MTREEQLACLIDRPCNVCRYNKVGCSRWKCVFEEEPTDVKPLYKIDTDGHIEEVNKIKEFYNKAWQDGAEATAYHIELCNEETPTIPMSVIEDIKAEIVNTVCEERKHCDDDLGFLKWCAGLGFALEVIDKHIQNESMFSDYPEMPNQFDNMTGSMNL